MSVVEGTHSTRIRIFEHTLSSRRCMMCLWLKPALISRDIDQNAILLDIHCGWSHCFEISKIVYPVNLTNVRRLLDDGNLNSCPRWVRFSLRLTKDTLTGQQCMLECSEKLLCFDERAFQNIERNVKASFHVTESLGSFNISFKNRYFFFGGEGARG